MVGAPSFFGVEIPTYPAHGAAARPGPYQHTPARRMGVEAPHTYIPRRAAWVWKRRIPTYPPPNKKRQSGVPWPIPSLVSWALVRRRQRWRPLLRRRAELFGRPHGERCCGVADGMLRLMTAVVCFFKRMRPPGGPYVYPHTRGARGDARRADTYIHRARRAAAGAADTHIPDKNGRRPARPIPTYPTRKKGLLPYPI